MLKRIPGTGSMGRGPFGMMKLYKPLCGSVRQPGHGPTRPNDRLGPESIFAVGGSADRSIGVPATADAIIRLAAIVNATTRARFRLTGKVLPGGCPTNQSGGAGPGLQTDREGPVDDDRVLGRRHIKAGRPPADRGEVCTRQRASSAACGIRLTSASPHSRPIGSGSTGVPASAPERSITSSIPFPPQDNGSGYLAPFHRPNRSRHFSAACGRDFWIETENVVDLM